MQDRDFTVSLLRLQLTTYKALQAQSHNMQYEKLKILPLESYLELVWIQRA